MVATLVRILGLRNVDVAEDVVQDALLRALEVWKYRGVPENPSAWLFQAARKGQVTILLKFLCGFSVPEIAQAFLTTEHAIEKRLVRAKGALKRSPGPAPLDAARLDSIHQALYLLFSEGYHGSHPERSVREELCAEALRLGTLLVEHPSTATPATFALLGMMCLHAARLPARIDDAGSLILLEAQDRSRWSRPLIDQGFAFLSQSACGDRLTSFHLEAGIAALHAEAQSFRETDWPGILKLYTELDKIRSGGRLKQYPFLEAAAGDLHRLAGRSKEARTHLKRALTLARNEPERQMIHSRLASL